ncbi:helix-turn-helix transcriptional regulator [Deinococcus roseus]|uniref:HTH luxR-type domain-containing protein n=1 Tax=Deinococcus roseus TaxID=392414 RepID=A0ABQ2CYI8_9DEIO|nr:LuxR family transcriptional regulator [Deinococcus roseus]GGJ26868.1 hypothetical protein GCM10008938_11260 [Deinococcus roseus]
MSLSLSRPDLIQRRLLQEVSGSAATLLVLQGPAGSGKSTLLQILQKHNPELLCLDDADLLDPAALEQRIQTAPAQKVLLAVRSLPYDALRKTFYQRKVHIWSAADLAFTQTESLHWGSQQGFAEEEVLTAHQKWLGWVYPMLLELQQNTVLLQEFLNHEVPFQPLIPLAALPEITPVLAGYLLGEQAPSVMEKASVQQGLFRGTPEKLLWIPGLRSHVLRQQAYTQSTPRLIQQLLEVLMTDQQHLDALTLVQQQFTPEGALDWLHAHLETLLLAGLGEQLHERFQVLLGQGFTGEREPRRVLVRSYLAFFGGTPYRASLHELREGLENTANLQQQAEFHALIAWWSPDPQQSQISRQHAERHLPVHRHFFRHIARVSEGREKSRLEGFEAAEGFFGTLLDQTLQTGLICESLLTLLMQAQSEVQHLRLRLAESSLKQLFELSLLYPERCRPLVAHARALQAQLSLQALQPEQAVQSARLCRIWAEKTHHAHLLQVSGDVLLLGQHFLAEPVRVLPEASVAAQAQLHLLQGRPKQALEVLQQHHAFAHALLRVRCKLDLGDHQKAEQEVQEVQAGSALERLEVQAVQVDVLVRLRKLSEARFAARSFWHAVQHEPVFLPLAGLGEAALLLLLREARKQGIQPDVKLDTLQITPPPLLDLSDRERTVLQFLAAGQSNPQMAQSLGISVNTIKYHLKHLYEKLGVSNREAARDLGQRITSGW